MTHDVNNRRKLLILFLLGASLASACSEQIIVGSSKDTVVINPKDPSAAAKDSGSNSGSNSGSTSSIAPTPEFTGKIKWGTCADDGSSEAQSEIECGTLEVPYDYDKQSIGSFKLFLTRNPASDKANRIGSMLVNPGGPGFGGSSVARDASYYFSADLLSRFDIVGWDPRGTGKSSPSVNCIEQYDEYFAMDSPPDTPQEKQAIVDASQKFNDQCEKNSGAILPYISTRSSAQDMNSIRDALGEEKITYFGFSYGSELGATWVTMFPKTVRAAVLDGASDPNSTSLEQGLSQAKGFEAQLDAFLADCSARKNCAFNSNGNSAGALDKLLVDIDAAPLVVSADRAPVTQGVMFTALAQAMYSDSVWPQLERALADAATGDGAGLLALNDEYFQRKPDGTYGNELEAFIAISCLDDPGPIGVEAVDAQIPIFTKAAKRFGPGFGYGYSCALWPVKQAQKVVVSGKGAGPVIVIGTTGDAATPLESSRKAARALEQGIFITVKADQHTGYGVNACIVETVDTYLIDLVAPKDGKICG